MTSSVSTLKLVRQTHLYFGIFIAPMLLFFAFTGALQTFSLHEATAGKPYVPPRWIMVLAQVHKNQTSVLAPAKVKLLADKAKGEKSAPGPAAAVAAQALAPVPVAPAPPVAPAAPAAPAPPAPAVSHRSALPEKIFVLFVAIGLFTSTLTGIYMAYRYNRNKWVVTGLLIAGIVIPLALLPV